MSRHLTHAGHVMLGDGSVLWLLPEMGQHVAAYYWPDHTLRAYAYGSLDAMSDLVDFWQASFKASLSSPLAGDRPGPVPTPDPGHQLGSDAA